MATNIITDEAFEKTMEHRADHIPEDDLAASTATGDFVEEVSKVLLKNQTTLIQGPRGCGKTHMMRYAWLKCMQNIKNPMAIYVSFNRYYRLEPFLTSRVNATDLFHSWVLSLILVGLSRTLAVAGNYTFNDVWENEEAWDEQKISNLISKLERILPLSEDEEQLRISITLDRVKRIIDRSTSFLNRGRAILLLDDAALTLTPEYLIEFFEIVRSIKSSKISPKASVYPGTTEYGPRFHPTQEGGIFSVWLSVDSSAYSQTMISIARTRFESFETLPREVTELLMYAAFGIPRAYLAMLTEYHRGGVSYSQQRLNRIIQEHSEARQSEYLGLPLKAPRLNTLINSGNKVFQNCISNLTDRNIALFNGKGKQLHIGIPLSDFRPFVQRMMNLLVEAGLLYPVGQVSHGGLTRRYELYIPHLASLLHFRAFSGNEHGSSARQVVTFLSRKSLRQPLRRSLNKLLSSVEIENLQFDLPPCRKCGERRINPSQKFCHQCGSELLDGSAFAQCMAIRLDKVPVLTSWQRDQIIQQLPNLKTIGDLLALQDPGTEFRRIHRVGAVRATKMVQVVTTYVEEFLS
jgi:hypothetical protein